MSLAIKTGQSGSVYENPPSPAVFLDKDGTLMEDIPYNSDPGKFVFATGVPEGLRLLSRAGFRLLIISNQSGVARGIFPLEALDPMREKLREMFESEGLVLDGVYWCPHHPEGNHPKWGVECDCRKPEPGMLLRAAKECNIDLAKSWMIGDRDSDVGAARNAGCHGALLATSPQDFMAIRPDLVATNFFDIAASLVAQSGIQPHTRDDKAPPNGR